jgi:class 3 adenylate cyclase/predicted ATPase
MFCDLVGSTALAARLDPEDLSEVIRAYQSAAAAEIARFDGRVAKFLGDGILAYFGWPRAHEEDAERAVRAALAITEAVTGLRVPSGEPLAVRIGIATGLVVVGDLIGEGAAREETVVGETPNLAARLQTLAEPNAVVIGRRTRTLIGGLFDLQELGGFQLKGFALPIQAWRVLREGAAQSRFEAQQAAGLTPLVGREQELALLLDRWQQAKEGEGQAVLLEGEPGIGKSRLVRALREVLGDAPYLPLSHFCSPFYRTSALHPVIAHLERAAGIARDDPAELKLDKLEALLAAAIEDVTAAAPLIAAMLSIPSNRYPPLTDTAQRQKELTLEALLDQLAGLAAKRPVLALYEDVQWSDPTTLELLGRIIERVQDLPVLVIVTFRPPFALSWRSWPHVTSLTLNRLSRKRAAALAAGVTGGKPLPSEVLEQIAAKAEGVPLFVEELTKTVLESGLLREEAGRYALTGPLPPLAIPATLHDSLLARLDRLAPVKEVAQIAAVIGREFSYELLAAVAPLADNELQDALSRLEQAELVFRRAPPPGATYSFKHALVRDAAYQSLLKGRRQQLHGRIAQLMEERFPQTVATTPELLARHFTEAGLAIQGATYWHRAGQRAMARSAVAEAIIQLTEALKALETLPDSAERQRAELGLQVALGQALIAARGYAALETGRAYARARELCRQTGDTHQLVPVLYGQYVYHLVRGESGPARDAAEELLRSAERNDDRAGMVAGHRAIGSTLCQLGQLAAARAHLERALALYNPVAHSSPAHLYAQDQRVAGLCWLSRTLFALGYPDQAQARIDEACAAARDLAHPHSVAHAQFFRCSVSHLLRDRHGVEEQATPLIAVCAEQGFPHWSALGRVLQGWALADGGQPVAGIAMMREGLAAYWATGAGQLSPYLLAHLAEALGKAGEIAEGLAQLTEAQMWIERSGERWYEAEVHRYQGELLRARPKPDWVQIEAAFRRAIEIAQTQRGKLWELRATIGLARLWRDQGKRTEARDLLVPVFGWFTEGFAATDLEEAKALLHELG